MRETSANGGADSAGAGRADHALEAGTAGSVRVTGTEAVAALVIVFAAFALRIWRWTDLGLNHFDEGVYVFSALGLAGADEPYTLFPNQTRFSPPFYFTATSLVHRWTGLPVDEAAILLNIVIGTLTVAAVWWVARQWFGQRAGLAAAALLALNQAHIGMSRVALTDAAFSFFFVLAILWLVRAVEQESLSAALLAGFATGLAWNTKYHGWFVLLITGAALLPAVWLARGRLARLRRPVSRWTLAAALGGALYVPWALYIRTAGGFSDIANYYLTLISTRWFMNFWRHLQQQAFLDGPMSRAALLVALALVLIGTPRAGRARGALLIGAGALAVLGLGSFGVLSLLALAMVPALLRSFETYRARVLLCWLGLWIVAAPVYHPYARLLLPYTVLTCILAGAFLARRAAPAAATWGRPRDLGLSTVALVAAVAVASASLLLPAGGNPWRPARTMAVAADSLARIVPAGSPVLVLGEPPLAFYVHVSGRPAFRRVMLADIDDVREEGWFVTGVYADRAPNLATGIAERADRLTRVASWRVDPNDLRLLDDFNPARARRYRATPDTTFDVTLYRIGPQTAR